MFQLRTPRLVCGTDIQFDQKALEAGTCGLFRAPLDRAYSAMPYMTPLIASAVDLVGVNNATDWEVDIKVHMLMPGQYPCIPNWHTDMVPRDDSGLRFDLIKGDEPPMYLWISDGPETEFLARPQVMDVQPGSHREIARFIRRAGPDPQVINGGADGWEPRPTFPTQSIQPNCWWAMDQQTPHRGTAATKHGWRVFARLTHKSMAPQRNREAPVHRRHAQVYLDAREFGW